MNERRMEDEPLQEFEENVNVQITRNMNLEILKRRWKKIWKGYMHKDYFGNQITEMHCVGYFIVLMIIKRLT